jgi:predicted regulator of Ras-like GTPase activity (Roadblock/LC7/MglB family)
MNMESILQSLHDVEGVQATLVLDSDGQLLAHRAHAIFDQGLLQEVGRTVTSAIDSLQLVHDDWELVNAGFADGKLLIRNLNAARQAPGRPAALAVVADTRLNPSFAGVAIRVAASRLKSAAPALAPAPVAVAPPALVSVPLAPPRISTPQPVAAAPARPASAAGDPRAAAFLAACANALASSVGPMAKVFVREAVQGLCGATPFGREHVLPLIAQLERHIDDPGERAQFRKTMTSP